MLLEKKACLILHGFTGGPFEVLPLAEHLKSLGYTVAVPILAGHGDLPASLGPVSYQDWLASAERPLKHLLAAYPKVMVIGFSMGGLIGIHLARKYPIQALVTLSAPIYILNMKRIAQNILLSVKNKDSRRRIRKYPGNLMRTPLRSVLHFKLLLARTKPLIPGITVPLLVVQGLKDDTVKPRSADYIYRRAGSSQKQVHYLPESGHLICCDGEASEVCRLVQDFLHCR
ncbi:alpha/beta hydrolase [Desulforamulus ruminis]|uniref:alpha/beta hydrolase n=1 Tax=Desulforamulus ruminis TaxID=1564 RepID=UPI002353F0DD|nr:alpha/beta fold hydrolase [Desulforamulus ruminis]